MNDDIVTRLGRTKFMQDADVETLCEEAAAEIERLRAALTTAGQILSTLDRPAHLASREDRE